VNHMPAWRKNFSPTKASRKIGGRRRGRFGKCSMRVGHAQDVKEPFRGIIRREKLDKGGRGEDKKIYSSPGVAHCKKSQKGIHPSNE